MVVGWLSLADLNRNYFAFLGRPPLRLVGAVDFLVAPFPLVGVPHFASAGRYKTGHDNGALIDDIRIRTVLLTPPTQLVAGIKEAAFTDRRLRGLSGMRENSHVPF